MCKEINIDCLLFFDKWLREKRKTKAESLKKPHSHIMKSNLFKVLKQFYISQPFLINIDMWQMPVSQTATKADFILITHISAGQSLFFFYFQMLSPQSRSGLRNSPDAAQESLSLEKALVSGSGPVWTPDVLLAVAEEAPRCASG